MSPISMPKNQKHFAIRSKNEYEFNSLVAEITILDQRGRVIWKHKQEKKSDPILWTGRDLSGAPLDVGSYTCKIRYADGQEFYLPFVYMR
jgi:flagellar hook assembly protein FlgD